MSTDGTTLFSYMLPVATIEKGVVRVLLAEQNSKSTGRHLGIGLAVAHSNGLRIAAVEGSSGWARRLNKEHGLTNGARH